MFSFRSITQLYATVAAHCSHRSLVWLRLACRKDSVDTLPDAGQSASFVLHGAALRPLFAFINLRIITLSAPAGFDLDDDAIAELALAWPDVQTLELAAGG
jgi:hypothetical protein